MVTTTVVSAKVTAIAHRQAPTYPAVDQIPLVALLTSNGVLADKNGWIEGGIREVEPIIIQTQLLSCLAFAECTANALASH